MEPDISVAAQLHATSQSGPAFRALRNQIVRELRAQDPEHWTMSTLAKGVGCSKELIAHILKFAEAASEDAAALRLRPVQRHQSDLERQPAGPLPRLQWRPK